MQRGSLTRVEISWTRGAHRFVEAGYRYTHAEALRHFDPFQALAVLLLVLSSACATTSPTARVVLPIYTQPQLAAEVLDDGTVRVLPGHTCDEALRSTASELMRDESLPQSVRARAGYALSDTSTPCEKSLVGIAAVSLAPAPPKKAPPPIVEKPAPAPEKPPEPAPTVPQPPKDAPP